VRSAAAALAIALAVIGCVDLDRPASLSVEPAGAPDAAADVVRPITAPDATPIDSPVPDAAPAVDAPPVLDARAAVDVPGAMDRPADLPPPAPDRPPPDAAGTCAAMADCPAGATCLAGRCAFTVLTVQTPEGGSSTVAVVELGMKFRASVAGDVVAIRYWKRAADTGAHTGRLWSATGTMLASVGFTAETAAGWQTAAPPTPVRLTANAVYVVTVNATAEFAVTLGGLATEVVNGPLSSVADDANGVFIYNSPGTFPTMSLMNRNYFRDVVFVPSR
jgi:hypothetical protein